MQQVDSQKESGVFRECEVLKQKTARMQAEIETLKTELAIVRAELGQRYFWHIRIL